LPAHRRTRRHNGVWAAFALIVAVVAAIVLESRSGSSHDDPPIPSPPPNASETTKVAAPSTAKPVSPLTPPELRTFCRGGDPLFGVYSPGRLTVKNPCVAVTGVVGSVTLQHDGDLHISLTEVDSKWLNEVNIDRTNSDLVVEIVPAISLPAPALQSRITVIGPWVLDTETGWLEIHPAWKILPAG
jgi:hypothetical protein